MKLRHSSPVAALAAALVSISPLLAVEPVIAPDDGTGTIAFPVVNVPITNSTRVRKGMQELKTLSTGIQTEMVAMTLTSIGPPAPGGSLGGSRSSCTGVATIVVEEDSSVLSRADIPVTFVVDTAPTTPGDAQQAYAIDVFTLQGQIFGDPDFDLLRIQGGSSFGLPSPGQTTLERLGPPGSDFAVDSFFDIEYQIEFQGAPGSALEGMGGTFSESARCQQPLRLANGVPYETTGGTSAVRTPDGISTYGGGGGGGVIRLGDDKKPTESFTFNYQEIKWAYSVGPSGNGLELPNDSDSWTLDVHVNPLADPVSHICRLSSTTTGGQISTTMDFSELGATATRVEVWHDGQLVGSAVAPNGTPACSVPARDFQLQRATVCRGGVYGATVQTASSTCRSSTLGDIVVVKEMDKASPLLCSTPGGDFLGSEVRLHPVGATLRVGTIGHVDHGSTTACVFEDLSVRIIGGEVRALGDAGLSKADSKRALESLRISNLGSSGCDGVSIDVGEGGGPPVRVEIEEVFTFAPAGGGGAGGSIWLHARDALGNSLGEMRLQDSSGSGGGGRIAVTDFSPLGSSTALVRVYQDELFVGERQVVLTAATQVASIDDAPGSNSRMTACGKNEQSPPFQFPCFFAEFDRPVLITPTGAPAALSGNRMEVLADAVSGSPNPLRFFEILTDESPVLTVSGIHLEPTTEPVWVWTPADPVFPPSLRTVCGDVAVFDTSAGAGLPVGTEGVQFRVQISDLVDLGPDPGGSSGNLFDCTVEIAAEGLGSKKGYDYYKAVSSQCVIDLGTNAFAGQDVQQFETEMLSMDLTLPPDPDFQSLRIQCGSLLGLPPCPGQVSRTKLPSGDFNVESFFDIEYQIDFQGAPGSEFDGVTDSNVFSSRWQMYRPQFIRWGVAHAPLGQAELSRSPSGSLSISNLGSSGCDGVSINLAGSEGATVVFEPHVLLPGAHYHLDVFGDMEGQPVGSKFGHLELTRPSLPDSHYDLELAGPAVATECIISILDNGAVVSETPVAGNLAACRLDPFVAGNDPPAVRANGILPATGGKAGLSCVFDSSGLFTPPGGGAQVAGNEIRMTVTIKPEKFVRCRALMGDDDPWFIEGSSLYADGRWAFGDGYSAWRHWDVVRRADPVLCPSSTPYRCQDGSCQISPLACPALPPAGDLTLRITPRDAASGLPTGKRQHKPLNVSVSGVVVVSPGQTLGLSATGSTDGGPAVETIGELELTHNGTQLLTSVQWPYQLSTPTRVIIRENPLHEEPGNTAANPLYEGLAPVAGPPALVDGAAPVVVSSFSAAPGDGNPLNLPYYLSVTFLDPVTITAPDGLPYVGREIIFAAEDVALSSDADMNDVVLRWNSKCSLAVDGIFSGPQWNTGLAVTSLGSADFDRDSVSGGLTVSNIGSSGCDGVSIDLQEGNGGVAHFQDLVLTRPGAGFNLECAPTRTPGVDAVGDLDRDGLLDVVVASNNDNSSCWVRVSQVHAGNVRVVCRDRFGNAVGDYILPHDDIGVCSPGGGGGGTVRLEACGWVPPLVTSLGELGYGPFLRFSEPVSFSPASGPSVTCSSITVHCHAPVDGVCGIDPGTDYSLQCRLTNFPDTRVLYAEVTHFRARPHTGLGAARLRADAGPETLTVSNIGSSGEDGVSIDLENAGTFGTGGSGGEDKLTENVTLNFGSPVPVTLNHTSGGGSGGRIAIHVRGSFDPNGGPGVPLGVCALDTDSDNDSVPIEVDFSDLGIDACRVVVLDNGQVAGELVESSVTHPLDVCRIYQLTALAVTGCGWQASEPDPGGRRVPYFSWGFESPVAVRPPGDPTAVPIIGDEVRLLVGGDLISVVPQAAGTYVFDLRVTDNPSLGSLSSLTLTAPPRNDFAAWLELHFTPAEIAVLASQNFLGDFDGDGCSDTCEFVEGTDPRVADSPVGRGVALSTVAGPADSRLIRLVYHTADVDDASVVLRSTTDLQTWNEDLSQFRLHSRDLEPDGRWRWEWEVNAALGSKTREFYGHRTILK